MIDWLITFAASNPVEHVTDKPIYGQWYFSNVTLMLILSGILTLWLILPAAKKIATGNTGNSIEDHRSKGLLEWGRVLGHQGYPHLTTRLQANGSRVILREVVLPGKRGGQGPVAAADLPDLGQG